MFILPNPNWFAQSVCFCTRNDDFIYIATSKIVLVKRNGENLIFDMKKKSVFTLNYIYSFIAGLIRFSLFLE
jgi:hypothetical protein